MELNGREVGFKYSMRAAKMFADFCPERNFSRIGEALSGQYGNLIDNQAAFIVALNTAYCRSADHRDEGLQMITTEELLDLDQEEFQKLFLAAAECMTRDRKTHVETKPAPRKKGSAQPNKQS
jgi:hypothetical protein